MNFQTPTGQDISAVLAAAREAGVLLAHEKGQLKVWGPRKALQESDLLEHLRANRQQLIEHFAQAATYKTLVGDVANRHAPFPLTEIQRAYWVGRQQAFEQSDVSIHYYTEVEGTDLDHERLQWAWNQTVKQHDMLRAVVDQDAVQRILPEVSDYEIAYKDLRQLTKAGRDRVLAAHRDTTSQTVHSTEDWPGFALHLFRLTKTKYRLTYSQDLLHIDGGSLLNVVDTFCRFYTGEADEVTPFDISFRDYVYHETAVQETDSYKAQLDYWKEAVKDLPPPPNLPSCTRKRAGTTFQRRAFELDAAAFKAIQTQAEKLNITPTTYIMTLFAEVVSAWNGADDYTLNVTVFNRPNIHPQIQRIAGDFTSMMPVAIRRAVGDTVADRAGTLQKAIWDQMSHKDVSGITILDLLRKAKGEHGAANLSVVFTSLLNLSNQGLNPVLFDGIGAQSFTVTQTPQVTLDHQVFETAGGGIGFSWDVIEEHFPEGMIDDMLDSYRRVIEACLAEDAAWRQPSLQTLPPSHAALYAEANDTEAVFDTDQTLRDLFYAHVRADPDAPALATSCETFSYAETARLAEQLAHRLQQHGTHPGDRVGVFMEKGWQQAVAAMATHVCGACYVPIDPTAPQDRLRYIVEDASLKVLLVDPTTAEDLGALNIPCEIVDDTLRRRSDRAALSSLAPSDVSHLIYTSGSTGKPKGVIIEHRNVLNRMLDINGRFDIRTGDAILGLTALHHDLSVYDIFGIWAAGAKLVLPDVENRLNPDHWCDLMRTHGVTLWNSVPAFASMLTDFVEGTGESFGDIPLRWMILAGDWIPVSLPGRVHAVWPELRFIASGGPTETTIWDIWNEVDEVAPDAPSVIYGKPLANATYQVRDAAGQSCPVWVPGEMYIGGAGVTRGYLNRDDLNAEKYLTCEGHDTKLFRSGDLGRYLPNGSIEFLGRNDFQVKINGQRIELGEVEAAATALPSVSDAVAVVQNAGTGPELSLFVVDGTQADAAPDLDAQTKAFEAKGVTVIDPTERLEAKLKYAALTPAKGAALIGLPPQVQPQDVSHSHRVYQQGEMSFDTFARFFEPLQGWMDPVHGEAKLQYGSAGGLYPVQVYVYIKPGRVAQMSAGVYRYFPLAHAFEKISACDIPDDMHWGYNRPMGAGSAFWVYLIADTDVIRGQYGDLAEPMCLIEAGMISQLLRDATAKTGIGVCSCGDIGFERYRDAFKLCHHQQLLTSMTAGLPVERVAGDVSEELTDMVGNALRRSLPKHMVPVRIAKLAALPLTGNGKVDRKRLMEMARAVETASSTCVPPAGAFEATVVEVLCALLGRDTVSVTDNFFEIGANSALLVKAYRQITESVGETFPLIELFRFPTVRSLSSKVARGDTQKPKSRAASARAEKQKALLKSRRSAAKGKS